MSRETILLTGGAGFIGHNVLDWFMHNSDFNIVCLDRLDFSGNQNRIHQALLGHKFGARIKLVYHDLRAELNDYTKKSIGKVDYILHLAAQSHVDRSIEFPLEFVADNVVGTANILDYARKLNDLKMFVYFSTDEVFGPAPQGINYPEYARYNSTNPYSASKAAGEELTVAFHNTYNLPAIITHTMNVFGRRQHSEKFIPSTIRKIVYGEEVTIHSNASKTVPGSRYYIHTDDVSRALYFLLTHNRESILWPTTEDEYDTSKIQKYNLVGLEETNNLELAQMIADHLPLPLKYRLIDFHSARPGHDLRYALSGDKMRILGCPPLLSISQGIGDVVSWYLANEDWLFE